MGDRPVGERAYGEGGQAGMYAGERGSGSAAEKREKLPDRGAQLVFKSIQIKCV